MSNLCVVHQPLQNWALSLDCEADLERIFGATMDWTSAYKYLSAFRKGDFSLLPPVTILPPVDMPNLWGGYSRILGQIFISADCPPHLQTEILLEEIGHFLDQELCVEETPGDEGVLFAAAVLNRNPENQQRTQWATETELHAVTFQGRSHLVEAAPKIRGEGDGKDRGSASDTLSGGGSTSAGVDSSNFKVNGKIIYAVKDSVRLTQTQPGNRLIGSKGNDTYIINNADVTIEDPKGGTDTMESTISASLLNYALIENLTLLGASNLIGTGNFNSNRITGNSGNNSLIGGGGDDSIVAGGGNDTLLGGTGLDNLQGGTGNDFIDGGSDAAVDTLQGGSGDDTYFLRDGLDKMSDEGGIDTIQTPQNIFSLANYGTIENLRSSGTSAAVKFTGNNLNNLLFGTSNADSLDGGAGADTLIGGAGNDTFLVNSASDVTIEYFRSGKDLVVSTSTDYTLNANIENLTLGGTISNKGSGNSLSNILAGNIAANSFFGGKGNDSIFGGQGNDTLNGGEDNDLLSGDDTSITEDYVGTPIQVRAYSATNTESDSEALAAAALSNFSNISITSAKYTGSDKAVGFIDRGINFGSIRGQEVKFGSGIILSTGLADTSDKTADDTASTTNKTQGSYLVNDILKNVFNPTVQSRDSATVEFTFIVNDPFAKWISMDILFGSEEYPKFINSFPDIAGVFIDGKNAAFFNGDNQSPLSVLKTNGSNGYFLDNSTSEYSSVYGGLTPSLTLAAPLGTGINDEHSIKIVIADTNDSALDSAIFVSNIRAVNSGVFGIRNTQQFGNDSLLGGIGNDTLLGTGGNDTLRGEADDDSLYGGSGNDFLDGGAGDDIFDGGAGINTMQGGAGNDTYYVNNLDNIILEAANGGSGDWIVTTDLNVINAFKGDLFKNIEKIQYPPELDPNAPPNKETNDNITGTEFVDRLDGAGGNDTIIGLGGDDSLLGSAGNDSIDGGLGADKIIGGSGNDTFIVDNSLDNVIEKSNEGIDLVVSKIDFNLTNSPNVENLTLGGTLSTPSVTAGNANNSSLTDANLKATGNSLSNNITGNTGKNTLDGAGAADILLAGDGDDQLQGGAGDKAADFLYGGNGNDVYFVDSTIDTISDSSGTETIYTSVSFNLGSDRVTDIENLVYIGKTKATLSGNAYQNSIVGSFSSETLFGHDENDTLDGQAGNDLLSGGADNDSLIGGLGADTMLGGIGNDTYVVDNIGDKVLESSNQGNDVIFSSITTTLLENIEILALTGAANINAVGNQTANSIVGNAGVNKISGLAGNDTLDGGAGNDTMDGGSGNDYYIMDRESDFIVDSSGIDAIEVHGDFLGINKISWFESIENIIIADKARIAFGNDLDNRILTKDPSLTGGLKIFAGLGDDTIIGALGADILDGQFDNDTIYGGGVSDISQNTLRGGYGNDTVEGGSGADLLFGGINKLPLYSDGDSDPSTNRDSLIGGDGNDTLDGGLGRDTLVGGKGNDIYIIDNALDIIKENDSEGTDAVLSTVSLDLGKLDASVENATLIGSIDSNLTGEIGDNILKGNIGRNILKGVDGNDSIFGDDNTDTLDGGEGDDYLEGGLGSDSMVGGYGNDTFMVDAAGDRVIEAGGFNSGIEEVSTAVNFDPISPWLVEYGFGPDLDDGSPSITKQKSFASIDRGSFQNLENFIFTESAIRGIANALDNSITGNAQSNVILGQGGSDTLEGNDGNDSLFGESDGEYATKADLQSLNPRPSPGFSSLIKYLEDEITGGLLGVGSDELLGGKGNDWLDGGALDDMMVGGEGDDTMFVDNVLDRTIELSGEGEQDLVISSVNINQLGNNIENLIVQVKFPTPWQLEDASGAAIGQPAQTTPANLGSGNALDNIIAVEYTTDDPLTEEDESVRQFPDQSVAFETGRLVKDSSYQLTWDIPEIPSNTAPFTSYVVQFRKTGTSQWITFDGDISNNSTESFVTDLTPSTRYDFKVTATGVTTLRGLNGDDILLGSAYTRHEITTSTTTPTTGTTTTTDTNVDYSYSADGVSFRESLVGGNGNDYIDGGAGVDTLEGGFGNDTLVVDDPLDAMREYGVEDGSIEGLQPLGGRDTVITSVSLSLSDTIVDGGKFIENLQTSNDEDGINLTGNRLNNIMRGGEGDNQLFGKAGNDSLVGGNGSDWISGDAGDDILWGTTGNGFFGFDAAQIDTLTGGEGRDTFALADGRKDSYYVTSGEADYTIIRDFDKNNDKLGINSLSNRNYTLSSALPSGVTKGQSLYFENTELIAVIQTSDGSPLNLSKDSIFTTVPSFFKI